MGWAMAVLLAFQPSAQAQVTNPTIQPGDSREAVLATLGEPRGTVVSGSKESLLYDQGTITLDQGKVVEGCLSPTRHGEPSVHVGDSREAVLMKIGFPKGSYPVASNEVWIYEQGTVTLTGGKVISAQLMSVAEFAQYKERERQREQEAVARKQQEEARRQQELQRMLAKQKAERQEKARQEWLRWQQWQARQQSLRQAELVAKLENIEWTLDDLQRQQRWENIWKPDDFQQKQQLQDIQWTLDRLEREQRWQKITGKP
jgi:hypothetical protein